MMLTLNKIPLKNIKNHFSRSILLIFLLTLESLSVFYTFSLVDKMKSELEISEQRFGADIIVYPYASLTKISKEKLLMQGTPICYYLSRSVLKKLDNCDHIKELTFQVYILDETGPKPIWIIGIEEDRDFVIRPWLKENHKIPLGENEVFAGSKVTLNNNQVKLFNHNFKVLGQLDTTGSQLDSMVYVSMETLKNIIEISKEQGITDYKKLNPLKSFSSILINTDGPGYVSGVTSWINLHMRKIIAVRSEESLLTSSSSIHSSLQLTITISLILWFILLAALFIAQSMIMKERKKELYVWFSIGASIKKISKIMLLETLILVLSGFMTGFLIFIIYCAAKHLFLDLSIIRIIQISFISLFITLITGTLSSYVTMKYTIKKMNGQMLLTI